ncbi:unnamed protein product [Allacma fusca]|uniref:Uncharacterized protein n=1 Tax=Allacma fusca TaxID=39272 RepID=A0A8J2NNS6_9HEXA|nr:unnamed protein product [Allacma fusca]
MTAQEFATYVFPTQILPQKDVIDLFLYFNSDSTVREDVAKRIQFSSARRKQPITFKLYKPETNASFLYNNGYEFLEYRQGHEDNYQLWYTTTESTEATNFKTVELDSLLLKGFNYDYVLPHWPSIKRPELEYNVCVTVEKLGTSGAGTCVFIGNSLVRKGETTNLKVCPRIKLVPGEKHRIKVKYQGNVLVIKQNGQRDVDWNFDMLTNTKLTPTLSDPNLLGTLEVDMATCKPPSEPNSYNNGIYCGPRPLHFLVDLIVIN